MEYINVDDDPIEILRPLSKPNLMHLVEKAGFDVSDWTASLKSSGPASSNPKYCYEWGFEQAGLFILNIWFENFQVSDSKIFQSFNLRSNSENQSGIRRSRANKFESYVKSAFESGSHPRAVILDRPVMGTGSATARMLDPSPWTIVQYDALTGWFKMTRGILPIIRSDIADQELESFEEGEVRWRFVKHRKREGKLRAKKIAAFKAANSGRLFCEVVGCGFDFEAEYGALGKDYAQVHHLVPLKDVDEFGTTNSVDDLAIVCANCHAMIHKGGECRDITDLKPASRSHVH